MQLEKKDKQHVQMLDKALRFARAKLTADITAQRLLILISVFQNEGMNQRELLKTLESTSITALSRNLADLSTLTSKKLPGPGLLELRVDSMNLRIKRIYLTARGRSFLKRWLKTMGSA